MLDTIGSVSDNCWDAYMWSYNQQQEQQMRDAQLLLDSSIEVYNRFEETGLIHVGKNGYHTVQAAREGSKALAYLLAPIPTPIDEYFAFWHTVKGVYHLIMAGKELLR